jgi:hypothetical protein
LGEYRRAVCEVVFGCRVVVMEQVPRGSRRDMGRVAVASDDVDSGCAAKGVLAAVVRCKGEAPQIL